MATVAAIAGQCPEVLEEMFVFSDEDFGVYGLKLFHNGEEKVVIVDEFMPSWRKHVSGRFFSDALVFGRTYYPYTLVTLILCLSLSLLVSVSYMVHVRYATELLLCLRQCRQTSG